MTDPKSEIVGLAERLEKATGPNRGLDFAVAEACGKKPKTANGRRVKWIPAQGNEGYGIGKLSSWVYQAEADRYSPIPQVKPCERYTASLDAAMSLVPELNGQTAYPQLQRVGAKTWQAHLGYANKAKGATGTATTSALALCAAALRARATLKEQSNV